TVMYHTYSVHPYHQWPTARRVGCSVAVNLASVKHARIALYGRPSSRPSEPELDRRVRVAEAVDLVREPREDVTCSATAEKWHAFGRDRVDLRELLGHLRRQHRARISEVRPLHDPPADRLARHALADERGAAGDLPA